MVTLGTMCKVDTALSVWSATEKERGSRRSSSVPHPINEGTVFPPVLPHHLPPHPSSEPVPATHPPGKNHSSHLWKASAMPFFTCLPWGRKKLTPVPLLSQFRNSSQALRPHIANNCQSQEDQHPLSPKATVCFFTLCLVAILPRFPKTGTHLDCPYWPSPTPVSLATHQLCVYNLLY